MNMLMKVTGRIFYIKNVHNRCITTSYFLTQNTLTYLVPTCGTNFFLLSTLQICQRRISTLTKPVILGIESSCDDSGAAIIDGNGTILSQSLYSQGVKSVMFGGVVPVLSLKFHEANIQKAVTESLEQANLSFEDLTAIAVTVKPGNVGNLRVGCKYAKNLCRVHKKPLIPVHHMEAHALTTRMIEKVEFPFLAVLISGGHFIFAVGRGISDWVILMDTSDGTPGVALDQVARRLKLKNLAEYENVCGGRAIELAAKGGNFQQYTFRSSRRTCPMFSLNSSFSGIKCQAFDLIEELEKNEAITGGNITRCYKDLCASVQHSVAKSIIRETQKAMACARYKKLIFDDSQRLVLSGGVACNQYIRNGLEKLCKYEEYSMFVPPLALCTDNGVMIAWTGLEQWRANINILHMEKDFADLKVESESSLGYNIDPIEFRNVLKPKYMQF